MLPLFSLLLSVALQQFGYYEKKLGLLTWSINKKLKRLQQEDQDFFNEKKMVLQRKLFPQWREKSCKNVRNWHGRRWSKLLFQFNFLIIECLIFFKEAIHVRLVCIHRQHVCHVKLHVCATVHATHYCCTHTTVTRRSPTINTYQMPYLDHTCSMPHSFSKNNLLHPHDLHL